MLTEIEQRQAISAIAGAAFDWEAWPTALEWLRLAGDGWCSQILGVSAQGLQFNLAHKIPPDINAEFEERGGADPRCNLRARIFSLPVGVLRRDLDIASPDEIRASAFFNEFLYRVDSADLCLANIRPVNGVKLCAAAFRDRKRADLAMPERDFPPLLAAIHDSIRIAAAIGQQGSQIFSRAFSCLDVTAFAADADARVIAITARAEKLIRDGRLFRMVKSRLSAAEPRHDGSLQTALRKACVLQGKSRLSLTTSFQMRSMHGALETIEITPVPAETFSLRFGPVALVIVADRAPLSISRIAQDQFSLTIAEADIAEMLCEGKTPREIASNRDVSVETIRSQIKAAFAKTGVSRQSDLVALLYRNRSM